MHCGWMPGSGELWPATHPYLAADDGLIHLPDGSLGLIEVKCPLKHCTSRIVGACKDPLFCLEFDSNKEVVHCACMCYFVVRTWKDMFIEEIKPDADHWSSMQHRLTKFCLEHYGKKILERLLLE